MWGQKWGQMFWGGHPAAVPAIPAALVFLLALALLALGYMMGRRQRAPRWFSLLIGLGVALIPVAIVQATTTFGVPFSFTNGTVADATQVNQNFSAITTEVNSIRNQTAILSECDFKARDSAVETQCGFGVGGARIIGTGDGTLMGVVRVPMGATITSVDVWFNDTNATTELNVCLASVFDNSPGYDFATPCVASSGTPGIAKLTINAVGGGVVQGALAQTYQLFFLSDDTSGNHISWPTDGSLTVRTAYVHYQLP